MPAQAPRADVRKRFNALTRECYEDGAPTSTHVGKEMTENDRWLTTQLRRTIFCQGFPIAHPLTVPVRTAWYMPPVVEQFVTPGCQNGKLVITALIPLFVKLSVKVWTSTNPRFAINQGEAEDRFRGGSMFDLAGTGIETTYTEGWVHGLQGEREMLFPISGGAVDSVQFGFRNFSQGPAQAQVVLVSSLISDISDDGGTITVQAGALAALPVVLNGYTYDIYDNGNDRVIQWGEDALSCDQNATFKPARRIWDRRLVQGIDAKADLYLRIYGPQDLEIYSIAAFEHVRREVP